MAVRTLIVEDDPNLIVPQYLLERRNFEVIADYEGAREAPEAISAVTDVYIQKPNSNQELLTPLSQVQAP